MTPTEALARIREIVDACGSPGCVACPRAIRDAVGEVDGRCSFMWVPSFASDYPTLRCELPAGHGLHHQSGSDGYTEEPGYRGPIAVMAYTDEQAAERMTALAAEVHRLRQEVARLKREVGRG